MKGIEKMKRTYKLAYNFNTVELEFTEKDYVTVLEEDEMVLDEEGNLEYYDVEETDIIERILQREFDILTSISQPISPESLSQITKKTQSDPPSPAQIRWAKNLGMKNPEQYSRQEVAEYIQRNK